MSNKCKTELHSWNGCKCENCGEIRDMNHDWNGCICSVCLKKRDEQHDFSNDCKKCSKCNQISFRSHDLSKDCEVCSICGKTGNLKHLFYECKCVICNKVEHDWSLNCELCMVCGVTREDQHYWNGCICSYCEVKRDSFHSFKINGECVLCGKKTDIDIAFVILNSIKNKCESLSIRSDKNHFFDSICELRATWSGLGKSTHLGISFFGSTYNKRLIDYSFEVDFKNQIVPKEFNYFKDIEKLVYSNVETQMIFFRWLISQIEQEVRILNHDIDKEFDLENTIKIMVYNFNRLIDLKPGLKDYNKGLESYNHFFIEYGLWGIKLCRHITYIYSRSEVSVFLNKVSRSHVSIQLSKVGKDKYVLRSFNT